MSVYVDSISNYPAGMIMGQARRWGTHWSHMVATNVEELLVMAIKIGLKPSYLQHPEDAMPHFDVTPPKRALAIRYGAIEINDHKLGQMMIDAAKRRKEATK